MRAVAAYVALLIALAGCLYPSSDDGSEAVHADDGHDHSVGNDTVGHMSGDLLASFTDCTQASGISVYDLESYRPYGPQEPWVAADMSGETGGAMVGAEPNAGPLPFGLTGTAGHWHVTVSCNELVWGWVGVMIERPAFDPDGPDLQFLFASLSMPHGPSHDAVEATGLDVSRSWDAFVDHLPGDIMHQYLEDSDHGTYETRAAMRGLDEVPERTIRMWMQVSTDGTIHQHGEVPQEGATWRPVAIDFVDTSASRSVSYDTTGWFSHSNTTMHAPLPSGDGTVAAVEASGFDREIRVGPAPDVLLTELWQH